MFILWYQVIKQTIPYICFMHSWCIYLLIVLLSAGYEVYRKFSHVVANLKKSLPVSEPAEFKPMLYKGQMYNALLLKIIKK